MAPRAKISNMDRMRAIILHEQGHSMRKIAEELKRSVSCVHRLVSRFEETKSIQDRHRSGRPPVSTPRDDRVLARIQKKNRTTPSHEIAKLWKEHSGVSASPSTVRRKLLSMKLECKVAVRKPRLTKSHIQQRRRFCKTFKTWSKQQWRNVIFSDEMNVEVDNRKCRVLIRRQPHEKYAIDCILQRTKQGSGSVGIWACMSYRGDVYFKIFDGRLNQYEYADILKETLLPNMPKLVPRRNAAIFQHDNAPCHRAKSIQTLFAEKKINAMVWPANSPDLNPIENLWSWLDRQIAKDLPRDTDQLRASISKHLSNVPEKIIQNLIDSMPTRIRQCMKNRCGVTKY